ncbi:MAG: NfeD family protein [Bowdeniella nasicola]|nr:NfeD family protein [Bowdeniella nasicola]
MGWLWWLGAVLVLVVIEMITVDFIFLMLSGGALAGMIAHLLGGELWVQFLAFSVAAVILLFAARPPLKAWMQRHTPVTLTNAEALVGRPATVLHEVSRGGGRVKLAGEVWSARTDSDATFAEGTELFVHHIDGAIAVVGQFPAQPKEHPHA